MGIQFRRSSLVSVNVKWKAEYSTTQLINSAFVDIKTRPLLLNSRLRITFAHVELVLLFLSAKDNSYNSEKITK